MRFAAFGLVALVTASMPIVPKAAAKAGTSCQRYGTSVDFLDNPTKAAELARKENKLLFVLHVAGCKDTFDFCFYAVCNDVSGFG